MSRAVAVLPHTYRYPFASHLASGKTTALQVAASNPNSLEERAFFQGLVSEPGRFGVLLAALSDVVAWDELGDWVSRTQRDPVVTSSRGVLRFEGLSGTCSMHARVDVEHAGFEIGQARFGTTNVDFNRSMRSALRTLRDGESLELGIHAAGLRLTQGEQEIVERKVELPTKWVRGFCEVAAKQRLLSLHLELPASQVLNFVRGLPRKAPKRPWFVSRKGNTLALGLEGDEGAFVFRAPERLRVLEPVLRLGGIVRIWVSQGDDKDDTTLWEVLVGSAYRFSLLVGGDPYRGFSAGGAHLAALRHASTVKSLPLVRASLAWQSHVESATLARELAIEEADVEAAFAILAGQGLVGFDPSLQTWFHRELPFDLAATDDIHPRLLGARELVQGGNVKLVATLGEGALDYEVLGHDLVHYVRLRPTGDKCSCTWYSTHQAKLGPCKHMLAARQVLNG